MAQMKRSKSASFAPSKRLKLDEKSPRASASSSLTPDDSEDENTNPPDDMATISNKKISQNVRYNVREIFSKGAKLTWVSNNDVLLVATSPEVPGQSGKKKIKPKPLSLSTHLAIRRAVMKYCASYLSKDLIACGLLRKNMARQIAPVLPRAVCYVLSYSTSQAASKASAIINTFPLQTDRHLSDGDLISLSSVSPEGMTQRNIKGKLIIFDFDEAQFAETMSEFASKDSPNVNSPVAISDQLIQVEAGGADKVPQLTAADCPEGTDGGIQPDNSTSESQILASAVTCEGALRQNERFEISYLTMDGHLDRNEGHENIAESNLMNLKIDSQALSSITRLCDLSEDERSLQNRYWGISHDQALAHCPICSRPGHMSGVCPSRKCKHCGVIDAHFSSDCTIRRKCFKCRERGHDLTQCPSKLTRTAEEGLDCDLCRGNHKEEDCSWVWRTFIPADIPPQELVKVRRANVSCYECGSTQHWGDDCLALPKDKAKASTNDIFSAKFVNQFLVNPSAETSRRSQQFSIRGLANESQRNGKGVTEDPDEESNFFGKRVQSSLRPRPSIQVSAGNRQYQSLPSRPSAQANVGNMEHPNLPPRPSAPVNTGNTNPNRFTTRNAKTNRQREDPGQRDYRSVPPPDQARHRPRDIDRPGDRNARDYSGHRNGLGAYDGYAESSSNGRSWRNKGANRPR